MSFLRPRTSRPLPLDNPRIVGAATGVDITERLLMVARSGAVTGGTLDVQYDAYEEIQNLRRRIDWLDAKLRGEEPGQLWLTRTVQE